MPRNAKPEHDLGYSLNLCSPNCNSKTPQINAFVTSRLLLSFHLSIHPSIYPFSKHSPLLTLTFRLYMLHPLSHFLSLPLSPSLSSASIIHIHKYPSLPGTPTLQETGPPSSSPCQHTASYSENKTLAPTAGPHASSSHHQEASQHCSRPRESLPHSTRQAGAGAPSVPLGSHLSGKGRGSTSHLAHGPQQKPRLQQAEGTPAHLRCYLLE